MQDTQGQMNSMSDSGNFKKWNQITVGDCLRFPVNQQRFQVIVLCGAATNACHLAHGMRLDHRKTFSGNQFSAFDSPQNHYQGIHHSTTPSAAGSVTERLVARGEDRNKGHHSNADICKKAVDHEFIISGGCSAELFGWATKTADIGTSI